MRLTKYEFENNQTAFENGCSAFLKDGSEKFNPEYCKDNGYSECWEATWEEIKNVVDHVEKTITCSITTVKQLLKQFGGRAWTEHYDREGSFFESTNISLKGNNSKFKYTYHL